MRKKVVTSLVALMTVANLGVLPVQAGTISGEGTGQTQAEFTVTAEDLGGGLTVTIPDKVVLVKQPTGVIYEGTGTVTADGSIEPDKTVEIGVVGKRVEYTNSIVSTIKASGRARFDSATDVSDFGTNVMSEAYAKITAENLATGNPTITLGLDTDGEIKYMGTYTGVVDFNVSIS